MDIRSIESAPQEKVHQGTVQNWWLFEPEELKSATRGGFLELVAEFEVKGGGEIHPHQHHTLEFYYVLFGRGTMTIGDNSRPVRQGDLVRIPPDTMHSLKAESTVSSIRCLAFSVGLPDTHAVDYVAE